MSDNYTNILETALGIEVILQGGQWVAIAHKLPNGSPRGYDICSRINAKYDLIAKIMQSSFSKEALIIIREFREEADTCIGPTFSYEFTKDRRCKVTATDIDGRQSSRVMKMIPEEGEENDK